MPNGIDPTSLYNLLQNARVADFKRETFAVTKDSTAVHNGFIDTSDSGARNADGSVIFADRGTPESLVNQAGKKYQYDIFDRFSFQGPGVDPETATDYTNNAYGIPSNSKKINPRNRTPVDNRLIINYKNSVTTELYNFNDGSDPQFVNKINPKSELDAVQYKEPSLDFIVSQLSKSVSTKISYADFAYCKKLGAYPNNRLVILRRFFQPVDDDLMDYGSGTKRQSPLAVMVTWFDEFPLTLKFGENWSDFTNGLIQELSGTISSLSPMKGDNKYLNKLLSTAQTDKQSQSAGGASVAAPWLKVLWYQFVDSLYTDGSGKIPPHYKNVLTEANPNLIRKSVIKENLTFSTEVSLKFSYVMRSINGIDPHLAMHNIYANAIRMGTSTSVSIFPKNSKFLPDFVNQLNDGKVVEALTSVYKQVSDYIGRFNYGALTSSLNNIIGPDAEERKDNQSAAAIIAGSDDKNGSGENTKTKTELSNGFTRQLFSLYRFKLTAALQSDMGTPSGCWHVTIGNPFNPIVSMGDLVIAQDGIIMSFGKELSYDDQPTEVNFSVNLRPARERGAQEIEQMFNNGRGRIYVYPHLEDDPDLYLSDINPSISR